VEESDLKGSLIAGIDNEANKMTSPIVATATEKINLDPNVNDNANESIKNNYGYILLHRRIMDWKWFKKPSRNDPSTFIVFLYLLMKANYEDSLYKAKGIIIERGCLVTGIRSMEKDLEGLGVTIQNIRTALKHLKDTEEIKREPTDDKQASIITIVNYNRWQAKQNTSNTPKKTLHDYMRDRVKPEYHHTEEETEQAKETLDYFNQVTHHTYRYNESNLDPIIIRVREGWNTEDLKYALEDILDMDDSTQCTEETDPATHLKRVFVNDFATLQKRTRERERRGG
jgi:hypothetical protein